MGKSMWSLRRRKKKTSEKSSPLYPRSKQIEKNHVYSMAATVPQDIYYDLKLDKFAKQSATAQVQL